MTLRAIIRRLISLCYYVQLVRPGPMFHLIPEKRLNSTAIEMQEDVTLENCMGLCFLHDMCKSFNAYQSGGVHVCEILEGNRCDVETKLIDSDGTSYMDLVAQGECPSKNICCSLLRISNISC